MHRNFCMEKYNIQYWVYLVFFLRNPRLFYLLICYLYSWIYIENCDLGHKFPGLIKIALYNMQIICFGNY